MGVLGGNIGEGVVRYWPQRTRSYFWGFLRLCQVWWKSIKKCDCESACRRTDALTHWQTDWQTQTDFIVCPMLYAIAMWQIIRSERNRLASNNLGPNNFRKHSKYSSSFIPGIKRVDLHVCRFFQWLLVFDVAKAAAVYTIFNKIAFWFKAWLSANVLPVSYW